MEIEESLGAEASVSDVLSFVEGLLEGESNRIANLANISALLHQYLKNINWVGFYLVEADTKDFVLGPFAGRPACTRITPPRGVVGTAVHDVRTLVVDDVLQFPGHIACDSASRSEIVVPIVVADEVVAVLDVDSPHFGRFAEVDKELFEAIAKKLENRWSAMREYR